MYRQTAARQNTHLQQYKITLKHTNTHVVVYYSVWAAQIRQVSEAAGIRSAGAPCDADKVRSEARDPLKSPLKAHPGGRHTEALWGILEIKFGFLKANANNIIT